jgi:hypothetical protein
MPRVSVSSLRVTPTCSDPTGPYSPLEQGCASACSDRSRVRARSSGTGASSALAGQGEAKQIEVKVEMLAPVARKDLEHEAERVADLRGAPELLLVVD